MPVPASSGSFKTNILDMAKGDYAAFSYEASNGLVGTLGNMGAALATAQANEIPVTGASSPSGYAYAVKARPGLLICDRPLQTGIPWDSLNAAKLIQGLKMTLNGRDVLVRALSGGIAFLGADGKPTTTCQWAGYTNVDHATGSFTPTNPYTKTFSTPLETTGIGFKVPLAAGDQTITEVQIFNENNVNIASQASVSIIGSPNMMNGGAAGFVDGDINTYVWDNALDMDGAFFTFTAAKKISKVVIYGHANYTLKEVYLIKPADPSLNIGFYPPTNEFDTYLRYSDLGGKIIAGDDAVWHHKTSVFSWCRETPMISLAASTSRIARNDQSASPAYSSGSTAGYLAFRPVFEFLETGAKASNLWY